MHIKYWVNKNCKAIFTSPNRIVYASGLKALGFLTPKILFIHSRASWQLALLTTLGIATGTIIPYTWLGKQLDMHHLPPVYYLWLVGSIFAYILFAILIG